MHEAYAHIRLATDEALSWVEQVVDEAAGLFTDVELTRALVSLERRAREGQRVTPSPTPLKTLPAKLPEKLVVKATPTRKEHTIIIAERTCENCSRGKLYGEDWGCDSDLARHCRPSILASKWEKRS